MKNFKRHLILQNDSVHNALDLLNELSSDGILFLTDKNYRLIGSLTDGDIRRGLLAGKTLNSSLKEFIQKDPKYIIKDKINVNQIILLRNSGFRIIPVVDKNRKIVDVLNFKYRISYLPVDVVIMAGGEGKRLRPLTEKLPKPLLLVGDKPIIEHNIDRLVKFGVKNFTLSVNYLAQLIKEYFLDGSKKNICIEYIDENKYLGTISSAKNSSYNYEDVIVMNSDILTTLNFEKMYTFYKETKADFVAAGAPYSVNVPYGVMETKQKRVKKIKEKPTYTYYSNAGIYIFKRKYLDLIPENQFYNATDLIEKLIAMNKKVFTYQMTEYWLDIGKKDDYKKAQIDINNLNFDK